MSVKQRPQIEILDDPIMLTDLGKLARQLRNKAGLKQEVVALEIGVSGSYVTRVEKGVAQPSLRFCTKLEDLYKAPRGTLSSVLLRIRLKQKVSELVKEAEEEGVDCNVRITMRDLGGIPELKR